MNDLRWCKKSRAHFRRECIKLRKENRQLTKDVEDMSDSHCTSFARCNNCGRLHDSNYICPLCRWDNSLSAEEQILREEITA